MILILNQLGPIGFEAFYNAKASSSHPFYLLLTHWPASVYEAYFWKINHARSIEPFSVHILQLIHPILFLQLPQLIHRDGGPL
jgi:hypothetical protein